MIIAFALSMLMSSVGISIANVALPTLAKEFGASVTTVQWIIMAYLLSITVLIVNMGRWGDRIGLRRMLLAGILLYTIGAIACALAPNLGFLIAARAIQGGGAAALMALTIALVSESVDEDKIGRAMGIMGAMSAIGTTLGPALGGFLIATAGWRSIFGFTALLGVLDLILVSFNLPRREPKKISHREGVTFSGTTLTLNLAMNALVSTVMMTTLVVGPFYLSLTLGLSAAQVGMVMSVGPICSALSGIPAGRIVDWFGNSKVVLIGLIEMALGATALTVLPEHYGLIGYIVSVAILSPGYQLFQAANNTAIMSKVESGQRGVVSGLLSLSRNLGLVIGAAVMGAVFEKAGMQSTFALAAVLIFVTIGLQVISGKRSKN